VVFELKLIKSYLLIMAQILQETFFVCVSLSVCLHVSACKGSVCIFLLCLGTSPDTFIYVCVCEVRWDYNYIVGADYMFYILDIWYVDSEHLSSHIVCVFIISSLSTLEVQMVYLGNPSPNIPITTI
jgi:hypothetical protein